MKKAFLIIIFILTFLQIYADEYNFRQTKWGMTVEEVKKIEDIKKIESVASMGINAYKEKDYLFDKEFDLNFIFENNKLTEGSYTLTNYPYEFKSTFVIFNKIFDSLCEKYGKNSEQNMELQLYLMDKNNFLEKNPCTFECKWELNHTDIVLSNIYVNHHGSLTIEYQNINRSEIPKILEDSEEIFLGYKGKNGFRNSKWGTKTKEVKNQESLTLTLDHEEFLIFNSKFLGMPCEVVYSFKANKLNSGGYGFNPQISTPVVVIDKFIELKKKLINIYGTPYKDTSKKVLEFNKDQKTELAKFIYKGSEMLECKWTDVNYDIRFYLSDSWDADFDFTLFFSNTMLQPEKESKDKL